jgi:hypothetical protein
MECRGASQIHVFLIYSFISRRRCPMLVIAENINVRNKAYTEVMKTVYLIRSFRDEVVFSPADIS